MANGAPAPSPDILYRSFMAEIKLRTAAIDRFHARVSEQNASGDSFVDAESAVLQLRYICELIALASLTAHQIITLSADLMKSWNAETTFKLLVKQNPHCFPRALAPPSGTGRAYSLRKEAMNLDEFKRTYSDCGELLHRGALKHFRDGRQREYVPETIVKSVNRIKDLLALHTVMLLDRGVVWVVQMHNDQGNVEVRQATAPGPSMLVED